MRRRVAILTGIFPPDIGGPATSVPELARSLVEHGHEVAVVTLAEDTSRRPGDPCEVVRIDRRLSPVTRVGAVLRAVVASRPDVVFANGLHVESALVPRIPVVQKLVGDWAWERARNAGASDHGIEEFQEADLPLRASSVRLLRSAVARRARLVVAPSRFLAGVIQRWGIPSARIRVVPNAAPPVEEHAARERLSGHGLFAGRLVAWKNVDHVLRVLKETPDRRLDIVGSGPELQRLQDLAGQLGIRDRVFFLGPQPRERVLERMRRASFLVLPSSYEGMPHVVLEAFAQRLPVVASASGGTPEVVEHGVSGILFPCGDLGQLSGAMETVLLPDVAQTVVRGGVAVARRLSSAAMTAATIAVLDEVLGADASDGHA